MKFWDSSAILPLLVEEPQSLAREELLGADPEMAAWFSTPVECCSALMRRMREGAMTLSEADKAMARLRMLEASWVEVSPSDKVRTTAERLLRVHPLRAADALQLAAAWVACRGEPSGMELVCADERLSRAARLEGFAVVP